MTPEEAEAHIRILARRVALLEQQLRDAEHRHTMLELTASQFFQDNAWNHHFLSRSGALAYYRATQHDKDADLPTYLTEGKTLQDHQAEEPKRETLQDRYQGEI